MSTWQMHPCATWYSDSLASCGQPRRLAAERFTKPGVGERGSSESVWHDAGSTSSALLSEVAQGGEAAGRDKPKPQLLLAFVRRGGEGMTPIVEILAMVAVAGALVFVAVVMGKAAQGVLRSK